MACGHHFFMREAIAEGRKALAAGEVPVGAVVVQAGVIVGRGYNRREALQNPLAHAEVLAIQDAAAGLGCWRLTDCQIYVTLEPCHMCAGAIVHARLETLVFGAYDQQAGCVCSLMNLVQDPRFNHQVHVYDGICEEECRLLLKEFFTQLRAAKTEER